MKLKKALAYKKALYNVKDTVVNDGKLSDDATKKLNKATYDLHDQNLIQAYKSSIAIYRAHQPNYQSISDAQIDNFQLNRELTDKNMNIMLYYEQVIHPLFLKVSQIQDS